MTIIESFSGAMLLNLQGIGDDAPNLQGIGDGAPYGESRLWESLSSVCHKKGK